MYSINQLFRLRPRSTLIVSNVFDACWFVNPICRQRHRDRGGEKGKDPAVPPGGATARRNRRRRPAPADLAPRAPSR